MKSRWLSGPKVDLRYGTSPRASDGKLESRLRLRSGMIHSVEEVDHGTLLLDGPSRARDGLCRSGPLPPRCGPAAWRERELCDQARQAPSEERIARPGS